MPDRHQEFKDASALYVAIQDATKFHLETEFIVWFLREIRAGENVLEAIVHAKDEWDIE